jgi:hypothetical protein
VITYSAEPGDTLLAHVPFNAVDAFDQYVETHVKLLVLDQERVFDIPLH